MFKKFASILFTLLANTLILAHVLIPHHHHYPEQICYTDSHCETDDHHQNTDSKESEHDHDNEKKSVFCILKQIVGIPANQVKIESYIFSFDLDQYNFDRVENISENTKIKYLSLKGYLITYPAQLYSEYCFYINKSSGLRAPPTV